MTAFGSQEWFMRAIRGEIVIPNGVKEGEVSVKVFATNWKLDIRQALQGLIQISRETSSPQHPLHERIQTAQGLRAIANRGTARGNAQGEYGARNLKAKAFLCLSEPEFYTLQYERLHLRDCIALISRVWESFASDGH
jgi:hypothetical protein